MQVQVAPLVQAMVQKTKCQRIALWNKSDLGNEQLCGHSDGLDQFQTSGPTKTPYAEWTDWLPMDPYEALGHENA